MNRLFSILLAVALLSFSCESDQPAEESQSTTAMTTPSADGKTILAIFAHPDDESTVGPLLVRYAREGSVVHIVSVTDGRYGVTEHAGIPAGDSLASVREEELICAGQKLGATSIKVLGYHDQLNLQDGFGSYMDGFRKIKDEVINLFEVLEPDVVITWNSSGWTSHPDHRIVNSIVEEVFESRDWVKPSSLLMPGLPAQNVPSGIDVDLALVDLKYLNVQIEYSEEDLAAAKEAWLCHKSQYTREQVEEMWGLESLVNDGKIYLQSKTGSKETRNTIF